MRIRIEAFDLPGLTRPATADGAAPAPGDLHVAVQRRDRPAEVLGPQRGDATSATWTLECAAVASATGVEVTGPYVQHRLGHRFVYLSWGTVDESGRFAMFRRAKLMLDAVPADVLDAAVREGLLVARFGLTDEHGGPLCARITPPHVVWTAGSAA
ncbi:DUF5990 family protein [Streptomyces sp. ALI-76-A]|uniref:DUF5990 family protein n=1 Tax=Streptomyces sp. ALI-76-A TaxID=3025736 RepID=UPI00256F32FC|nr:DUF5990 family protein [Streptomyces sp. ALI-76-A]MDL5202500.1 DUF5990 family protein [Streptomyces sp. ALI-76-A]